MGVKRRPAPAPAGLPGGLVVNPVGDGVRVEAVLAAWDEISWESSEALAEFLLAKQLGKPVSQGSAA